jgi:hypothetical protein
MPRGLTKEGVASLHSAMSRHVEPVEPIPAL